jgi:putative spermidine/putrescine transport system substrate-binding protein
VERAFAQLARIHELTAWWDRPAQPGQWLAAGEVALAFADQGRITAQVAEGADLGIVWTRSLQAPLFWAVPAGSPNEAQALEFLAFASAAPQQAAMADRVAAAPALRAATPIAGGQGPHAPQTRATAIPVDDGFWAGPGVALEARLAAFAAR